MNEYVRIEGIWHILNRDCSRTRCKKIVQWLRKWQPKTITVLPIHHVDAVCHAHVIPDIACVDCAMTEYKEGETC